MHTQATTLYQLRAWIKYSQFSKIEHLTFNCKKSLSDQASFKAGYSPPATDIFCLRSRNDTSLLHVLPVRKLQNYFFCLNLDRSEL